MNSTQLLISVSIMGWHVFIAMFCRIIVIAYQCDLNIVWRLLKRQKLFHNTHTHRDTHTQVRADSLHTQTHTPYLCEFSYIPSPFCVVVFFLPSTVGGLSVLQLSRMRSIHREHISFANAA